VTTSLPEINTAPAQDTFQVLVDKTNAIIEEMANSVVTADQSSNGSVTSGNVFVQGIVGANTIRVSDGLGGGNVQSLGDLSITTNVVMANSTKLVLGPFSFDGNSNILSVGSNLVFSTNTISVGQGTTNLVVNNSTISLSNNLILTKNSLTIIANSTVNATANGTDLQIQNGTFVNVNANSVTSNNGSIVTFGANNLNANSGNFVSSNVNALTVNTMTGKTLAFVNVSANVVSANYFSGNGLLFNVLTVNTMSTNTITANYTIGANNIQSSYGAITNFTSYSANISFATIANLNVPSMGAGNVSITGTLTGNGASLTGVLKTVNNLSDITNSVTARQNLGLGSMAVQSASSYQPAIGYTPVNKAGDTITGALTVNGQLTTPTDPYFISGQIWVYGYGGNNGRGIIRFGSSGSYYLYWDGSTYNFSGAHVNSAAGRLWGTGDFDYPITAMRLAYAGDVSIGAGSETRDYWGGTVVTGYYYSYITVVTGVAGGTSSVSSYNTASAVADVLLQGGGAYSSYSLSKTFGTFVTGVGISSSGAYASSTANVPYPAIERRRYLQAYRNNVGWYTVGYS